MSSEELKPCPFCGGKAKRVTLQDEENFGGDVIVCINCDACSRVVFGEKEGLNEAWNARAQLAAIQGGMGEVVEVVGYRWVQGGDELNGYEQSVRLTQNKPSNMAARLGYEPVMTVAQHQRITAAMAAEVERLKRENTNIRVKWTEYGRELEAERYALRAEMQRLREELRKIAVQCSCEATTDRLDALLAASTGREVGK